MDDEEEEDEEVDEVDSTSASRSMESSAAISSTIPANWGTNRKITILIGNNLRYTTTKMN